MFITSTFRTERSKRRHGAVHAIQNRTARRSLTNEYFQTSSATHNPSPISNFDQTPRAGLGSRQGVSFHHLNDPARGDGRECVSAPADKRIVPCRHVSDDRVRLGNISSKLKQRKSIIVVAAVPLTLDRGHPFLKLIIGCNLIDNSQIIRSPSSKHDQLDKHQRTTQQRVCLRPIGGCERFERSLGPKRIYVAEETLAW